MLVKQSTSRRTRRVHIKSMSTEDPLRLMAVILIFHTYPLELSPKPSTWYCFRANSLYDRDVAHRCQKSASTVTSRKKAISPSFGKATPKSTCSKSPDGYGEKLDKASRKMYSDHVL